MPAFGRHLPILWVAIGQKRPIYPINTPPLFRESEVEQVAAPEECRHELSKVSYVYAPFRRAQEFP